MRTTDQHAMPHDLGRLSDDSDISDKSLPGDSNNRSKRGNAPLVNGPKFSCTCKRTKCLKLYCSCFSKNYHCGEACACEGCYNTTIYEDSVYKALDRIESREPNAFSLEVRVVEGANCSTTRPVIHQRGCNCKKSFCEKKYCECYQANIACSDKCRCEDCKNTYGTRNGYVKNAETLDEMARRDTSSVEGRLEGTAEINRYRSNLHLFSSDPSLQSSMEIAALRSHPTVSYNPLPYSVAEITECRELLEQPIQGGIDSNLRHSVLSANSAQYFDENMGLLDSPNAVRYGSLQSDGKGRQSPQSELIQGQSDHSDEGMRTLKPGVPSKRLFESPPSRHSSYTNHC